MCRGCCSDDTRGSGWMEVASVCVTGMQSADRWGSTKARSLVFPFLALNTKKPYHCLSMATLIYNCKLTSPEVPVDLGQALNLEMSGAVGCKLSRVRKRGFALTWANRRKHFSFAASWLNPSIPASPLKVRRLVVMERQYRRLTESLNSCELHCDTISSNIIYRIPGQQGGGVGDVTISARYPFFVVVFLNRGNYFVTPGSPWGNVRATFATLDQEYSGSSRYRVAIMMRYRRLD